MKFFSENNTWETAEATAACQSLIIEFERNLAKQKELRAAQQANAKLVKRPSLTVQKTVVKPEVSKPGPSTATQAG